MIHANLSVTTASSDRKSLLSRSLVLVLYRKRERAGSTHEQGVFARFRYNDLKEAGRGCGGRGHYGNSMVGKSGVEVQLGCAAARQTRDRARKGRLRQKCTSKNAVE